ncbi:hypothetical protein Pla175_34330 [Pirellulimonas nuda]|uniref:Glycosyl hydrolase-like 10 domain-containing protein n=1 Tax=Pirellulimonas nuda TaxID=2528009 RepID=A0A518DEY0_9BACT|nr:family 10 glycosylhydrolase [Pirellulimonas nuda]QDU90034.1 hypothetical protein Pla175_34330 [Pirellulimonas nuda]
MRLKTIAWALAVCGTACCGAGIARGEGFADFRGMWVSRFEYSSTSPASVQQIMANAASLGVTDVLFQVRGRADAYYDSAFEPRAQGLSAGFDPLQTAIDAAHANGMKLHAWINTMPLWQGASPPTSPSHPYYNTDPSFRLYDINGVPESIAAPYGSYATVNPLLPEVHTHINSVVQDIASNYAVDGVHLDYIRWVGGLGFDTLPHDAQSHTLFNQATGLDGTNPANAAAYRGFIKDRITDLVGSLKTTVDGVELASGRAIDLSAAVWRDPDIAENDYLQDYRTWLEQDLLDIAMPMIYLSSSNANLLQPNLLNTLNIPTNTQIAPGLGVYLQTANAGGVDLTITQLEQLRTLGADGATLYSYSSFFGNDPLAAARREAVTQYYANLPDPNQPGDDGFLDPNATIVTDFESGEGYFGTSPTLSGSNQGINSASADRTTSQAHLGEASQVITIDGSNSGWFLRHLAGTGPGGAASPSGNLPLTSEGSVGFWLKTDTPGLSVQVAVDDPGTADRGLLKAIVADGQWRLYEWDLADDSQWEGWVAGDGLISGATVTLDSIQFYGAGDAVIYLDTVAHNPLGSLLVPFVAGDYDRNGLVDPEDLAAWRTQFGQSVTPGAGADGNGDGVVDASDYTVWRDAQAGLGAAAAAAVPEPAACVVAGIAVGLVLLGRRRGVAGRG